MNQNIFFLVDYRNQFWESTRSYGASIDLERIGAFFAQKGYTLHVLRFSDVDFKSDMFRMQNVLYQSSEDRGLLYKDYIEDILLGLLLKGANLIPSFPQFRAHHNKSFMEILRNTCECPEVGGIYSHSYGSYEDFVRHIDKQPEKLVMKPSAGALSSMVRKVEGRASQLRYARRLSSSITLAEFVRNVRNFIVRKDYLAKSLFRRKFVVQEFLPGLEGDYKVLVYGSKYYLLSRRNRLKDFRASGSGLFSLPESPPPGILDFASNVFESFDVPFISLDVAFYEGRYILIEFQFLSFGNYTLEQSTHYYSRTDDGWSRIREDPDLERELVNSVITYVEKR
jgi:hypothetical protein